MSALPPKADIAESHRQVRLVPSPDIAVSLDDLVGESEQRWRKAESDRFGRLEVDCQPKTGWQLGR
jgi:hypothetical protein